MAASASERKLMLKCWWNSKQTLIPSWNSVLTKGNAKKI